MHVAHERVRARLLGLLVFLLTACTQLPEAPAHVEVPQFTYRIGAGDELEVSVWRRPELSARVEVGPDGLIAVPLVESILAAGKSKTELAAELAGRLKEFLRDPVVTVLVRKHVGAGRYQIRIVGQAKTPGSIAYRQGLTVLDVMIGVGGMTPTAAGNRAVLIRREGSENKQYRLRLNDLVSDGDLSANVDLVPGDVIVIPEGLL